MKDEIKSKEANITRILHEVRKRKIFYGMYFKISTLKMYINSVYRPNLTMDMTHVGTIAKSVKRLSTELNNLAQEILDILESEKSNG